MNDSYSFSFPSFIKHEFLTKLAKVNKKLATMADANQVQIISESFETKKILKPDARKKVIANAKSNIRYTVQPSDFVEVVFSKVKVSLPIQNKINGFQLIGTINIEGGVKTIFSLNDNNNLSDIDVTICDHCNTKRKRNRLHVFTDLNNNQLKTIGSTCVHDYLGLDIDKVLNTFFNFYKEDDLYNSNNMASAWGYTTTDLMDACRIAFKLNPIYKKANEHNSTKSHVDNIFHDLFGFNTNNNDHNKQHLKDILNSTSDITTMFTDNYINLNPKESNFNSNLSETLFYTDENGNKTLRDFIVGKARGIFIWAFFNTMKNITPTKSISKHTNTSNYIGTIGDTIKTKGKVTFLHDCHSQFGTSRLVVITTDKGDDIKTFSTSKSVWDLKINDSVDVKGTVSKHEDYKGKKSTMIKRANFSVAFNTLSI